MELHATIIVLANCPCWTAGGGSEVLDASTPPAGFDRYWFSFTPLTPCNVLLEVGVGCINGQMILHQWDGAAVINQPADSQSDGPPFTAVWNVVAGPFEGCPAGTFKLIVTT